MTVIIRCDSCGFEQPYGENYYYGTRDNRIVRQYIVYGVIKHICKRCDEKKRELKWQKTWKNLGKGLRKV